MWVRRAIGIVDYWGVGVGGTGKIEGGAIGGGRGWFLDERKRRGRLRWPDMLGQQERRAECSLGYHNFLGIELDMPRHTRLPIESRHTYEKPLITRRHSYDLAVFCPPSISFLQPISWTLCCPSSPSESFPPLPPASSTDSSPTTPPPDTSLTYSSHSHTPTPNPHRPDFSPL